MPFSAKILADSIAPNGARLTTFELTFPRVILAEFNTHRMISRNAASSRAIPYEKLKERILADPFVPEFRENKAGMSAGELLEGDAKVEAESLWLKSLVEAIRVADTFADMGVHKQYVNRLLEPWMFVTIIASATDWNNLFHLRTNPQAEPSFQRIAKMAFVQYKRNVPDEIPVGGWHLPLVNEDDLREVAQVSNFKTLASPSVTTRQIEELKLISAGRCARVSYFNHSGNRDLKEDVALAHRLAESGHWSPFEHIATPEEEKPIFGTTYVGNFKGWIQFRKEYQAENINSFDADAREWEAQIGE